MDKMLDSLLKEREEILALVESARKKSTRLPLLNKLIASYGIEEDEDEDKARIDGRSFRSPRASQPKIKCPYCDEMHSKGIGLAGHIRARHPGQEYPNEIKSNNTRTKVKD